MPACGGAAFAASGAPHWRQNFASGAFGKRQEAHAMVMVMPQSLASGRPSRHCRRQLPWAQPAQAPMLAPSKSQAWCRSNH